MEKELPVAVEDIENETYRNHVVKSGYFDPFHRFAPRCSCLLLAFKYSNWCIARIHQCGSGVRVALFERRPPRSYPCGTFTNPMNS